MSERADQEFVIKLIIEAKKRGGVSADIRNQSILSLSNVWCYPKYPSKTKILSDSDLNKGLLNFINENKKFLREENCFLGVWLNSQTNKFYLDITTCDDDLNRARKTAKRISLREGRKIVSIYNPHLDKTIYLWENGVK